MDKEHISRLINFDGEGIDVSTGFNSVTNEIERDNEHFIKYLSRCFDDEDAHINYLEVNYLGDYDYFDDNQISDFIESMKNPREDMTLNGYSLNFCIGHIYLQDFIVDEVEDEDRLQDSVRVLTEYYWWKPGDKAFNEFKTYCDEIKPADNALYWWENETPYETIEEWINREITDEECDKLIELAKERFEDFKKELSVVLRRYGQ